MKFLLLVLFGATPLFSQAQTLPAIDPIKTVMDANGAWLDSLMAKVGDKRIVALGEDTHGTADFYQLRDAISRRLITEKGFNVMILENPHEDMMALQEGLQKERLDTLMRRHLFSIYQSRQMKDFLEWFKKYSRRHKGLRLAGCDDSYRELLPNAMVKEAKRYKSQELNRLCQQFLQRQTLSPKEFYAKNTSITGNPDDEMQYGLDTYRLAEAIDSLCIQLRIDNPGLKELVFHAKTAYVFYERFSRKAAVSRDEIMGERINYYAADPKAKIIVWAHSGHIARYAWLADELGLMGATVAKKFPADYLSIGMSSGQGSYSYIKNRFINDDHDFTDSLFTGELQPNQAGSWNEALVHNRDENFYLDFSRLSIADRGEFEKVRSLKLLGYGKQSDKGKDFYPVALPRLFDVLIFLRNTTHTTALFN
ncbi:MAG: erythromycin esterase family protein [Chitinophagaceae bacterium]